MGKSIEEHMQDDRDERQRHREAFEVEQKRAKFLEDTLESAVIRAERMYERFKEQADPYAMHKAIESLPVSILSRILNQKLEDQARMEMYDNVAKYIKEQTGIPIEGENLIHVKFSS
jgi:hypothetical protein